ncbi:glycosyltransferase [Hippea maritima]|uniref:Glycosyl transferase family 2 n=1 Tax=Hippea maritima (strain ATCC 700847 / DSM 10411 / MH2) TaxID=760142 RepID=F2LUP9_HIPMA|nr:glycosyltransferase [Hippea maritima]AEA34639.1 glycosyl transferase family 2 [Hippea maritima DSM 10411]
MKVCAVIVTYGDRFHLLKQVMDACYNEGVNKIIVVDNASEENSKKQLKEYEEKESRLKVIYLDENTGSAGGYKRGLQEAYKCEECEFIWLLDDDNQPQKDSLKVLKDFWNKLKDENKEEKVSLLSYRPDRIQYKEAIMTDNPDLVLGRKNSFLGFHIIDLPKKVIRVLKRKIGIKTFHENPNIKSGKVAVAPYGGMFFHKKLIDSIGYPKEEFFLYADDHEWSYRITKSGGKIFVVLDSILEDIDVSWQLENKATSPFYSYLNEGNKFRVYYTVRNRVNFEKNIISSNFYYNLNKKLFFSFLSLYKNKKNQEQYNIFRKAVNDGLNNTLGRQL